MRAVWCSLVLFTLLCLMCIPWLCCCRLRQPYALNWTLMMTNISFHMLWFVLFTLSILFFNTSFMRQVSALHLLLPLLIFFLISIFFQLFHLAHMIQNSFIYTMPSHQHQCYTSTQNCNMHLNLNIVRSFGKTEHNKYFRLLGRFFPIHYIFSEIM